MPKIDLEAAPHATGTSYPPPYDAPCLLRHRTRLGQAAGLTQFGVNLLRLAPGVWSSQRHWHSGDDEFVYVLAGEVVLVTGLGEQVLRGGDCAGFAAGDPDGHHLQNRSAAEAVVLEIGTNVQDDAVTYPGIDLALAAGAAGYSHIDGSSY